MSAREQFRADHERAIREATERGERIVSEALRRAEEKLSEPRLFVIDAAGVAEEAER
jgi:vacuolar-type H+-ATPase subunit H